MTPRHAICLSIDGLRASALGSYGNTIFPTPHFDALASNSAVVDWMIADSPTLEGFYRSVWDGKHALRHSPQSTAVNTSNALLHMLQDHGVRQLLFSDDEAISQQTDDSLFDTEIHIENATDSSAAELESTCLARFFAAAIEQLQQFRESSGDQSSLIWLHCRGMCGPWDAPEELRDQLLEEEDPPLEPFVDPPTALQGIDDPDQLLAYRVAYAAQVTVLDYCTGAFINALSEIFADSETLLMLFGSRGMPLGEHGSVGIDCKELFSEQVHLPWLICPLNASTPLPRQTSLAQPTDIAATLLDWFGCSEAIAETDGISRLLSNWCSEVDQRTLVTCVGTSNQTMIRTPAWSLLQDSTSDPRQANNSSPNPTTAGKATTSAHCAQKLSSNSLPSWTSSAKPANPSNHCRSRRDR